jgi:hypothetical protein
MSFVAHLLAFPNILSVAHVKRSVELAATCLNISESDVFHDEGEEKLLLR